MWGGCGEAVRLQMAPQHRRYARKVAVLAVRSCTKPALAADRADVAAVPFSQRKHPIMTSNLDKLLAGEGGELCC